MPSTASSETRIAAEMAAAPRRSAGRPVASSSRRLVVWSAFGADASSFRPSPIASSRHVSAVDDPVDQPPAFGLGRGDRLAGEQQGPRAALAHLADQVVQHDGGDQPPADLGIADPGVLRRDHEVAGRGEPRPPGAGRRR